MRKEKTLLMQEIKDKIDQSTSMIVAGYNKLEPNVVWEFREQLSQKQSEVRVVKKRIFVKAAEAAGHKIDMGTLDGHVSVVFINQEDALSPIKAVFEFSEGTNKSLQVRFGWLNGELTDGKQLEVLSKLPTMDELKASILALFTAPMSQMLSVIEAKIDAESSSKDVEQKS